jgi:phosphoglucosamine mutase
VRFGTDGLRGRAGTEITESLAYRLGRAVAATFPGATAFVGEDTRESSPDLAAATVAGLEDGRVRAVHLGVITTPGVAVIAQRRGGVGVVISASHNLFEDNGLKVIGPGGAKLPAGLEAALEAALDNAPERSGPFAMPDVDASGATDYVAALNHVLAPGALADLRIVLDCANGSASRLAGSLFSSLGARVTVIHDEPNGRNINEHCGSTHPQSLAETVRHSHADLGLAFDGDADRLIAVDSHGTVRDGDDLMMLFGLDLLARQELGGAIVMTQMSNLGLRMALHNAGIEVIETPVGDRHVLAALEDRDLSFGGEQSGHLIFRRLWPTGDGMLSGLLLAELVSRQGRLSALCDAAWRRLPQELVNVPADQFVESTLDQLVDELVLARGVRSDEYRLLVRPSGTEPVVRVMFEAHDADLVDAVVTGVREKFQLR